jgi:hypothetical protein
MGGTAAGVVMATAGYMSPEQARGQNVDKRADIWAFGAVLYELLTGEQLFAASTVSDSIAAVLTKEPDLSRIPAAFRRVVQLCLVKDPRKRLRDISGARILLEEPAPGAIPATRPNRLAWALLAVVSVVAAVLGIISWRHGTEEKRVYKLSVLPPENTSFARAADPAVSPDGRRLAFCVQAHDKVVLAIRDLDSPTSRALPGTEGCAYPFWSPDSRTGAFFAGQKLKKLMRPEGPLFPCAMLPHSAGELGTVRV